MSVKPAYRAIVRKVSGLGCAHRCGHYHSGWRVYLRRHDMCDGAEHVQLIEWHDNPAWEWNDALHTAYRLVEEWNRA